jgi:hypothetical protein
MRNLDFQNNLKLNFNNREDRKNQAKKTKANQREENQLRE